MQDTKLTIIANQVLSELSDQLPAEASEEIVYAEACTFGGEACIIFKAASAYGGELLREHLPECVGYMTRNGSVPVMVDVFQPLEVH